MSNQKDINMFGLEMKRTNMISESMWKATTTKRQSLVVPDGVRVYDTDLDKVFVGDGSTQGGVPDGARFVIRKIGVAAAASGATYASGTNLFTWSTASNLRTGDALTLTSGTGTLPSGFSDGTTYYMIKSGDVSSAGESNTGTTFKLASTRANAIAGTAITGLSSGASFKTVISDIVVQGNEDAVLIDPVSANVGVVLPDANTATGFGGVCVRRGKTATYHVNIKELDASGNISASGSVTIDDAAGYMRLKAGTDDYANLFADTAAGEYWTTAKQITS